MYTYVLIAAGLFLVVVSFFLSEKLEERREAKEPSQPQGVALWNEKDEEVVSERIEALLSEKSEAVLLDADNQLSRISNEKIMAVSEFSDQILEKMEQNHSEVIFLYNMLGEKEEEIKKLLTQPVPIRELPAEQGEAAKPESDKDLEQEAVAPLAKEPKTWQEILIAAEQGEASQGENEAGGEAGSMANSKANNSRAVSENQNERILKLHEEGKTVLEISRELNLGQGEVKLVIDLFQGVSG